PGSDMLRWGQGIETPAASREAYPSRRSFFREPQTGYEPPRRPRAESALHVTLAAVVVVGLLVTVLLVMRGWEKAPPTSGAPAPVAVSPPEGTKLPATNAVGGDATNPARSGAAPSRASNPSPARPATAPTAVAQPVAVAPPPVAPAAADSAVEPGRAAFALEVASFIDAERATAEADRIAGLTGQACRVVNDPEADSYAVVLGAFGSRRAAVRAADALLERDLVRQARVVAVAPEPATP
ncbi:MAG TPA: SPOR domain-containing protein, partial [Candidatus Eisenbacteria bacterium]|nr:SPOR domain-containing protein [Candidatus Eisenbacteria bacterium]